jgi:hypothetical protein
LERFSMYQQLPTPTNKNTGDGNTSDIQCEVPLSNLGGAGA